MKCKMSIQAKRKLLDSFAGRFYSIEWVNVNLNNLKHIRCGSIDIEFED